jgi:hypothetical protein
MKMKCASGEIKDDSLIYVCHHCGTPVCVEHGWVVPSDDAFDDSAKPISRAAMHCGNCAEDFHKSTFKQHGWTVLRPVPSLSPSGSPVRPGPYQPGPMQPGPGQPAPWQAGPGQPGPWPPGPGQPGPGQPGQPAPGQPGPWPPAPGQPGQPGPWPPGGPMQPGPGQQGWQGPSGRS